MIEQAAVDAMEAALEDEAQRQAMIRGRMEAVGANT
jgi:hypothetical protein